MCVERVIFYYFCVYLDVPPQTTTQNGNKYSTDYTVNIVFDQP